MAIQTHPPAGLGGAGVPLSNNRPGAWVKLLDPVLADSVWIQYHMSHIDSGQPAVVFGAVNFELGVGPVGFEQRWGATIAHLGVGGELEFDDSWRIGYLPFNFLQGQIVSGRIAFIDNSFPTLVQLQLQLFSP